MTRKDYTSIGIERPQFLELEGVKNEWEGKAGRGFRWGDFLMMLLTLRDMERGAQDLHSHGELVEMGQDQPASEEDEGEFEIEQFPGLPITLSEEDRDRIAERVAEKLATHLEELFDRRG